jgi:hypothetical protein
MNGGGPIIIGRGDEDIASGIGYGSVAEGQARAMGYPWPTFLSSWPIAFDPDAMNPWADGMPPEIAVMLLGTGQYTLTPVPRSESGHEYYVDRRVPGGVSAQFPGTGPITTIRFPSSSSYQSTNVNWGLSVNAQQPILPGSRSDPAGPSVPPRHEESFASYW